MTAERSIDYDALTQDALRGVVRTILTQVGKTGLPGDHHFYIAFDTQAAGVLLSRRLKEKYPEEMMIVLQHRFWDLLVNDDYFEVKLTFDGIPERLVVPFSALRVFFDPSVRFTLQFGDGQQDDRQETGGPRRRRRDSSNGNAEADASGQRSAGDRRPRPRPKARGAGSTDADQQQGAPQQQSDALPRPSPSLATRGGETVSKPVAVPGTIQAASTQPAPAQASPASSEAAPPVAAPAGAKVFSLDHFRKK